MSDPVVVPEVVAPEAAVVVVAQRTIEAVASVFVEKAPAYRVRKTASLTFRCMTPSENENVNWKKGLVYLTARYAKGVNLEMWLYSPKGGDHLIPFNAQVRALATDAIKCEPCGKAVKLRIQLPDAMPDEDMAKAIAGFIEAVDPTVCEIRGKVAVVVSKKETKKAAAPVVAAPAEAAPAEVAPAEAAPVAEVPPAPEVPTLVEPTAEAPKSKRQAKKDAKRAAKAA